MPRSLEEILRNADQLAERFESYEPDPESELEKAAVAALRDAQNERLEAEKRMVSAIQSARAAGLTWTTIGSFVGTSGEAARQRYSEFV